MRGIRCGALVSLVVIAGCASPPALGDGGDGGPAGADAAPHVPDPTDPCRGVPAEGRCADSRTLEYCDDLQDTESEVEDSVASFTCDPDEECQVVEGNAECVLTADCRAGTTQCADDRTLQTCTSGAWVSTACPTGDDCVDTETGTASCGTVTASMGEPDANTREVSGRLVYQRREPAMDFMGWDEDPTDTNGEDFAVLSYRGMELIDSVYTGTGTNAGRFTIKVPETPDADDRIVVIAMNSGSDSEPRWVVANPAFGDMASHQTSETTRRAEARVWSWTWTGAMLPMDSVFRITDAMGAGAAHIFNRTGHAYRYAERANPSRSALSVVAWLQPGVTWSCGNCFNSTPSRIAGVDYQSQVWVGGRQSYWSDATNGHEMGHWYMASYGRSPKEGGPHTVTRGSYPGLAWSDGFATFFTSLIREDPTYFTVYDNGSTTRWNLADRMLSNGTMWPRPSAMSGNVDGAPDTEPDGLLQLQSENDVSTTMWLLSRTDASAVLAAAGTARMTVPTANGRFERGYRTCVTARNADGTYRLVRATNTAASVFVDYLDSLACGGFSRDRLTEVLQPTMHYPFPVAAPLCR